MAGHKKSLRGRLLLDGGNLQGSWFHRSVVLVCQHDAEGAFGLVLNRPSTTQVGEALEGDLPDRLREMPLYVGGPVQPGALSYLLGEVGSSSGSVMPGIELGHSLDDLVEAAAGFSPLRRLAIFAGYSGWSAGQLDDEIARKAWLVLSARFELVFDDNPGTLWRRILRDQGGLFRLLADSPDDLAFN